MIAAIVAPAGARSIATIRLRLVSGRDADLDEAGANRLRDAGLAVLRTFGRVAAFGLDLGLVIGFSEVQAAPSAAPPQPRPGKSPGRAGPGSPSQPLHITTATLRSRPGNSANIRRCSG